MNAMAKVSVLWPEVSEEIFRSRNQFRECNKMARSQPSASPITVVYATYPLELIFFYIFHQLNRSELPSRRGPTLKPTHSNKVKMKEAQGSLLEH